MHSFYNRNMDSLHFASRFSLSLRKELLTLGREVDTLISSYSLPTNAFFHYLEKAGDFYLDSEREQSIAKIGVPHLIKEKTLEEHILDIEHCTFFTLREEERKDFLSLMQRDDLPRSLVYCFLTFIFFFRGGIDHSFFFLMTLLIGKTFWSDDIASFLLTIICLDKVPTTLMFYPEGVERPLNSEVYFLLKLLKNKLQEHKEVE